MESQSFYNSCVQSLKTPSSENYYNIDFFSFQNDENQEPKKEYSPKSTDYQPKENYSFSLEMDIKLLLNSVKTHQGSITYQCLISSLLPNDIQSLLIKLCPYLIEIMCSNYGNYFFQKLLQKLNLNQRLLIFSIIHNHFIQICANKSGTYSIQALIDVITTPNEEKMLQALIENHLIFLFTNENAHHIIQKIIIDFPEEKREYLNNCLFQNLDKICINEYGTSCVVKFIILNTNLIYRIELIKAINKFFLFLLGNRFGCSIILFMIEKYGIGYSGFVFRELKNSLLFLSSNKKVAVSLVVKVLNTLSKYDKFNFLTMTWDLLKNENLLYTMMNFENGINILLAILKNSTQEQKNYLKIKKINLFNSNLNDKKYMHLMI